MASLFHIIGRELKEFSLLEIQSLVKSLLKVVRVKFTRPKYVSAATEQDLLLTMAPDEAFTFLKVLGTNV